MTGCSLPHAPAGAQHPLRISPPSMDKISSLFRDNEQRVENHLEKSNEERYQAMAPKYEREQAALQGQREELAAEISKSDKVYENIEQFLSLIWKYTGITELTPYILNELIERIVVHEKVVGPDGVKTQQVDIYYKFVGCINQRRNGGCTGEVIKADKAQPGSRPA